MTHKQRLELIHRGLPPVRVVHSQKRWAGVFVNDYFGENLDARRRDQNAVSSYEGAFERELLALDLELTDVSDAVEVRQFVESQTRSHRKAHAVWQ